MDLELGGQLAPATIDAYWLTFLVGTILPALTALVTKRFAAGELRALILLLLSAVTGTLTTIGADGHVGHWHVRDVLLGTLFAFITAVCSHYGLLKPTRVTGDDGVILRKLPAGVGAARPVHRDPETGRFTKAPPAHDH